MGLITTHYGTYCMHWPWTLHVNPFSFSTNIWKLRASTFQWAIGRVIVRWQISCWLTDAFPVIAGYLWSTCRQYTGNLKSWSQSQAKLCIKQSELSVGKRNDGLSLGQQRKQEMQNSKQGIPHASVEKFTRVKVTPKTEWKLLQKQCSVLVMEVILSIMTEAQWRSSNSR